MVLSSKGITIRSNSVEVQAGLRICCSQTPKNRFTRVEAHIFLNAVCHSLNIMASYPVVLKV